MGLLKTLVLTATLLVTPSLSSAHTEAAAPALLPVQHEPQAGQQPAIAPEERMRRRFPQPVQVGNLTGLRVLDDNDLTIGIVRHVVRTKEGEIRVIIAHSGPLGRGGRLVAVPIEAVAILGRQLASLDMQPEEYKSAATWEAAGAQVLPSEEKSLSASRGADDRSWQ